MEDNQLKHIEEAQVKEIRVQRNAPLHNSVTGYGPKIPTRYMLKLEDNRWHRVYVVNYGNSGSAYVVYKGANHYLSSDVEHDMEAAARAAGL